MVDGTSAINLGKLEGLPWNLWTFSQSWTMKKAAARLKTGIKRKLRKETPDRRYERMMKKWQKANAPLGIIRSQGLRDEFDKKMSNRDKKAYLSGTPGDGIKRSRGRNRKRHQAPHLPLTKRQFTRAEAAQLEAELALSTKRNGKSETLQSATVDLTSKGLLVVTWDESPTQRSKFSLTTRPPVLFMNG